MLVLVLLVEEGWRRWDSEIKRCSSRSFWRLSLSSLVLGSAGVSVVLWGLSWVVDEGLVEFDEGGFEFFFFGFRVRHCAIMLSRNFFHGSGFLLHAP